MQTQNITPACKRNLNGTLVAPVLHPDDVLAGEGISITFIARLLGKMRQAETCWLWEGPCGTGRSGRILRGKRKGGNIACLRGVWLIYNGEIPGGIEIFRACPFRNRDCIHPNHIRLANEPSLARHVPLTMAQINRFETLREQSGLAISQLNALLALDHATPKWMIDEGFSDTFAHRFWTRVNKTESCWLWTGNLNDEGYGYIAMRSAINIGTHRASWMLHNGPVAHGLKVRHLCPNGPIKHCVNPFHLALGTHRDNMEDARNLIRQSGKAHWNATLIVEQVIEIRRLAITGATNVSIGKQFGIAASYVSRIKHRLSWSHIP